MATGTALSELVLMLKGELSSDLDQTVAPGGDEVLKRQLALQQKYLALNYDFSDLNIRREVNLVAGTRYYDFPQTAAVDDFELSRKLTFEVRWSTLWYPVDVGISLANYNALDPELNVRVDPVCRWQKYRPDAIKVQFEVWPLPASATRIRISGQMKLPALAVDADKAFLDDLLIVQWTAAKMLARLKGADAPAMLAEARTTLQRLIGGDNSPDQTFSMGGRRTPRRDRDERPTVAVNYTP